MALREQIEARLIGFDGLPVSEQMTTLEAIESDLRRALSADVPGGAAVPADHIRVAHKDRRDG